MKFFLEGWLFLAPVFPADDVAAVADWNYSEEPAAELTDRSFLPQLLADDLILSVLS